MQDQQENEYEPKTTLNPEAQDYVQDLMEKASADAGLSQDEEEEEEEAGLWGLAQL